MRTATWGVRHHAGVDISAPKMTPVVAVRDGTVTMIHADGAIAAAVGITHDDGWSSWYFHLNNDVDGSDDGDGFGIRPGLMVGTRVLAGEVIGWVGDSGNAEPSTPHLHFELHMSQRRGDRPAGESPVGLSTMPAPALESGPSDFSGPYIDDDGLPAEAMFGLLASLGVDEFLRSLECRCLPLFRSHEVDAVGWISASVQGGGSGLALRPRRRKSSARSSKKH